MKKIHAFIIILAVISTSTAQVQITKVDLSNVFKIGEYYSTLVSPNKYTVTAGTASANAQVFDFRSIVFQVFEIAQIVAPGTTPYDSAFASSTYARKTSLAGDKYEFFRITDSNFTQQGIGAKNAFPEIIRFVPEELIYKLPLTHGASWVFDKPATQTGDLYVKVDNFYSVDAWGTLRVPDGDFECLRIRKTMRVDIQRTGFTVLTRELSYLYLTKEGYAIRLPVDTLDENNATLQPKDIFYSKPGKVVSVKNDFAAQSSSWLLNQNYPNPFSEFTSVEIRVPSQFNVYDLSNGALKIFNQLGQEISDLSEQLRTQIQAGGIRIFIHKSLFPQSGIYYYRLTTPTYWQTKSMMLLR